MIDGRGSVPWSFTGDADMSLLVLACERTPLPYLAWLRTLKVPYLLVGGDRVDLAVALEKMRSLVATTSVVSHGGGGTNGALLRGGLVDELQMIWLPAVIGGADTPSSFDGDELRPSEAPCRMTHLGTVIGRHGNSHPRPRVRGAHPGPLAGARPRRPAGRVAATPVMAHNGGWPQIRQPRQWHIAGAPARGYLENPHPVALTGPTTSRK